MGVNQFGKAGRPNISFVLKRRKVHGIGVFLAALFVLSFLSACVPEAKADILGERTFSSTASDAQISYYATNFTEAWDAYAASWVDGAGQLMIGGVEYAGGMWNIARTSLYFSTLDIPDEATVTSAVLSLYIQQDNSTTDFDVAVQGTGTYPHEPVTAADYYRGWYGTDNLGSRSTGDGISEGAYWNITLNAAGLALISKSGTTRFLLRSSSDINGTAPSTMENIWIAARDKGEAYAARLYVSYTVASGNAYNYYFFGPYEDDGDVFNGTVHVKLSPNYNTTIEFDLVGDGVTPASATYSLEQQAILMVWNISDTGNFTRVRYFTSDYTETIYVFVPDPNLPFYLYGFVINDFVGVENGFLESRVYVGGTTRVVERQPINTINAAPFYMSWSKVYEMRVVADQGVVSVGSFTALAETNPTVIIPAGAFPQPFVGLEVLVNAIRPNSTAIQVNYTDSSEGTYWTRVYIKHRLTSGAYTTDYYENTTSNTYLLTWAEADEETDYLIQVQAYRGTVEDWSFFAPYRRNQTNTWEGLNLLGVALPVETQYIPAVVLIFAAALSFSYWHISAGAWIAWVTTAVCFLFGWLPYNEVTTTVVMGLGAVIAAGITIGEFKKGERSL